MGKADTRSFAGAVQDYIKAGGETLHLEPLVRHFKDRDVRTLRQRDLNEIADKLKRNRSMSTVNRQVHTPFIAIMRLAAENDYCDARIWRRPSQPEGRLDWRTPEDMDLLIDVCRPNFAALITFILGCFPRVGETLVLQRRDVAPGMSRVTFVGDNTKGGYTRSGPVPPRAQEAIERMMAFNRPADRELFLNDRKAQPYASHYSINSNLARACERAKIPKLTVHTLRHTGATWRYAMTKDLHHLMTVGGWRSLSMVQRYVHAGSDELAAAAVERGWGIRRGTSPIDGQKIFQLQDHAR
ncbi:MAG: tyrosine-type recombinase/integrase [Henriciella sp.]